MKKIKKLFIAIISVSLLFNFSFSNTVFASEINENGIIKKK